MSGKRMQLVIIVVSSGNYIILFITHNITNLIKGYKENCQFPMTYLIVDI